MRILIVDDDFLVRSNLKRLIETSPLCRQQGFSVACEATDGEQAMQMIPSARPDLVISDIRMPQMDGLELQEALKCAYPDILLVMLSGYDELDYVRQALKNGAIDYILKHELNAQVLEQTLRTAQERGECVLLEPWYDFTLRLPQESVGRALADMPRLSAEFEAPVTSGEETLIKGRAPVASLRGYAREVAAYTRGRGQLVCLPGGYERCHNAEEVIAAVGYEAGADTANTADSVFCSHGAGVLVRWDEAPSRMHLPSVLARDERLNRPAPEGADAASRAARAADYRSALAADKELMAIFERTYGPIRRDPVSAMRTVKRREPSETHSPRRAARPQLEEPEHLLVDGYNVIFAWDELKELAADNLDAARARLMDILCNYAGYKQCVPILVFDAYKVKGGVREVERYHNLYVVYTKEAETADMYIEKTTHEIARRFRTRVVTSDTTEQLIILGNGAMRISSQAFEQEVRAVEAEIREFLM